MAGARTMADDPMMPVWQHRHHWIIRNGSAALWAGVDYGSFLGRTGFQRRRMSRNRLYGEGVAANMYVLQSTHMYTYAVRRDEI